MVLRGAYLLLSLARLVAGAVDPNKLIAVLSVETPTELKGVSAASFATFSIHPQDKVGPYVFWEPPNDGEGCNSYSDSPSKPSTTFMAVVRRGTCFFVQKALNAQQAGAAGVVVVSNTEESLVMDAGNDTRANDINIIVLSVGETYGNKLIQWNVEHPNKPIMATVQQYHFSLWDWSELVIICLATSLVVAGAHFATADMRHGSPLAVKRDEVLEVGNEFALGFCFMGSIMLMILFFFMKFMIYVIIACFCFGGAHCITQITSSCLQYQFPGLKKRGLNMPLFGPVSRADVCAAVPALALVCAWFVNRNAASGWLFQDIIAAGFLCSIQRTLRLPNIKVATILLSAMFFFDIFWVFISPFFFQKSVMVEVAKGGGTGETVPMLLKIPALGDPLGSSRMLGFGDVALPGLLISYLLRHDIQAKSCCQKGYFWYAVIGYFLGLCATIVALSIMEKGQPALLYLVPGTLGTTLVLGFARGEIPQLWDGVGGETHGSDNEVNLADHQDPMD